MENDSNIKFFIKAVDKDYFDAFFNKGEICMNTLKTFKELESKNSAVGDKYEGASAAISEGATIELKNLSADSILKAPINDLCIFKNNKNYNILSLYSINDTDFDNDGIHRISPEFIQEFNHHKFCLITAPDLFFEKLTNEITKQGFSPKIKLVSYFPPNNNLKLLDPFQKRDIYEYQKEVRIIFENTTDDIQKFHIGTLKDFAIEISPNIMYKFTTSENKELIINVGLLN